MITQINIVKEPEYYYPAGMVEKDGLMTYPESQKLSSIPTPSSIVTKSSTAGLLKNDGTVDSNSYVKKSDIETEKTATGNPITLTDAIAGNAIEVSAEIVASQSGSGTPSPTNVRPISGRTAVVVDDTGKNVIPLTVASAKSNNTGGTWSGNVYTINGGTIEVLSDDGTTVKGLKLNGTFSAMSAFAIYFNYTAKAAMTLNGCPSGGGVSSYQLDINGGQKPDTGSGSTIVANTAVTNVRLRIGSGFTASGQIIKPMLSYEGGDYEPYRETVSVTIQLGQTVYGGSLDLTSGELTITHANIASYNGETIGEPWISSMDEYTQGGTPTTGAQVVYTLATPTTTTLTAAQLALVKGYNQLSCNSGDMEITYKASSLDAWKDRVNELDNRVDELEDAVEDIEDRVNDVETALAGKANIEPYLEQSVTLSTSQTTTVTFTDAKILATSFIEPAISVWGIFPEDVTVANGSCTVVMPQVSSAQTVTVGIFIKR